MPDAPTIVVGLAGAVWLEPTGEIEELALDIVAKRVAAGISPLLCHLPGVAARLGLDRFPSFDILELFAFVRPHTFCVPTPRGLGGYETPWPCGHGERVDPTGGWL